MARLVFCTLAVVLLAWVVFTVRSLAGEPPTPDPIVPSPTMGAAPVGPPAGAAATLEAAQLRRRLRVEHRRYLQARHQVALLRRRWRPTVTYAMHLASAVTGVPYSELAAVAWCESRYDPFARNGRYKGMFQLGWDPFGFSPFDPIASSLSAALTVRHDGSWRQWECKP